MNQIYKIAFIKSGDIWVVHSDGSDLRAFDKLHEKSSSFTVVFSTGFEVVALDYPKL